MIPRATYRLQFHEAFTFADAVPLAPYLAALGVSHVYASPIGTARAGSTHGYDQIDPTRVNPELGGEEGFRALAAALRAQGLGVILDIVPNHMAVGQADNRWWLDVLKHGEESRFAQWFDIDWRTADPALAGKVAAPFLGAPYAEALAAGDLQLKRDGETGELAVWAYDSHAFPLRPQDQDILAAGEDPQARFDATTPAGRDALHALLERQHVRLAWWKTAGDEINWRRFFDITELAGVRVERDDVFDFIHALPLRLYEEGLIDGVRADHVDGLADPASYCRKLRAELEARASNRPADAEPGPVYFVVEKILAQGERLSPDWRTDGTTGYDYMNEAAALLHDPDGAEALGALWVEVSGRPADFAEEERHARLETLRRAFEGQREACVRAFHSVARADMATRDLTAGMIRRGLNTLLSVFPVYRTYGAGGHAPASDRPILEEAVSAGQSHCAPGEGEVLQRLADWIGGEGPGPLDERAEAVRRFQQLSAPVSAKAVEDTAFYRYGRLLSRDDVGSDPARLSASIGHMHEANAERARTFPHAMLTTATHDHKRGEDVRARLAVISEEPAAWAEAVADWSRLNAEVVQGVGAAELYPLYQTLAGAWPLELGPEDAQGLAAFRNRVFGWWRKAMREAKLNSSWAAPDEAYEGLCKAALAHMLDPAASGAFLGSLHAYVEEIAPAGALNGLVQALLRCTAPGMPDLYQGREGWDFSLVDPDNRTPVDYDLRRRWMAEPGEGLSALAHWRDGEVKARLIALALDLRRRRPRLFANGDYQALAIDGAASEHLFAFRRSHATGAVVVATPLRSAGRVGAESLALAPDTWAGARLRLDRGGWRDIFSGQRFDAADLPLADLFARQPVVCLESLG